jgi:hypothetical protein
MNKASKSKKTNKAKDAIKLRADGLRQGSFGGLLVDSVLRKAGATHKELCQIVGWKACLPFLLKSCQQAKVRLRKEKEQGGQIRYYGTKKAARERKL